MEPEILCFFNGGLAGKLEEPFSHEKSMIYRFVPVRSFHHLRLVEELEKNPAIVEIQCQNCDYQMLATELTSTTISLKPSPCSNA